MEDILERLINQFSNNPISTAYFQSISKDLDNQHRDQINQIINKIISRYTSIPLVQEVLRHTQDQEPDILMLQKTFPTFFLLIVNECGADQTMGKLAKNLLIAAVNTQITMKTSRLQHINLILDCLDQTADVKTLNNLLIVKTEDESYIPKRIYKDFTFIASNLIAFPSTQNTHEIIENLFCFEGISRIILRYYFELLFQAKSDCMAEHIHFIFTGLILALRFWEKSYWAQYGNEQLTLTRLFSIVHRDRAEKSHPVIRKSTFERLYIYNPGIHNGSAQRTSERAEMEFKRILKAFQVLSLPRVILMLETILQYKGPAYVNHFLVQMEAVNADRLVKFKDYAMNLDDSSVRDIHKLIVQLLTSIKKTEKTSAPIKKTVAKPAQQILLSSKTARRRYVMKKLKEKKGQKGMTQDQITGYLETILTKLYQRVKKKGALNQDTVQKYLDFLAKTAARDLSQSHMSPKKVDRYIDKIKPIMVEIAAKDELTQEDVNAHTKEITQQAKIHVQEENQVAAQQKEKVIVTEQAVEEEKQDEENNNQKLAPKGEDEDALFLESKIIPIGFEWGAPKISVKDFFSFPLGNQEVGPNEDDWFALHRRYLEKAVELSLVTAYAMEKIQKLLPDLPKYKYRRYFDIFADDVFDDAAMMVVFSQWQNKVLERSRISDN